MQRPVRALANSPPTLLPPHTPYLSLPQPVHPISDTPVPSSSPIRGLNLSANVIAIMSALSLTHHPVTAHLIVAAQH